MLSYVFIGNSTKPSQEQLNDRSNVKLDNVGRPCLKTALDMNYNVILGVNRNMPEELQCEEMPISFYDSHTYRSITAIRDNYIAFRNLCDVIRKNDVKIIHCNTPVGGMIGRLAGKKMHVSKIIYTAHGFHFFNGAPLFNNTVLKWAEQVMAHWTDAIITMNEEDYQAALKFKLRKGGKVYKVHGVGITLSDFQNPGTRAEKRNELGVKSTDVILISAGDLVARKNYKVAIEAIAKANDLRLHYFICGQGPEQQNLQRLAADRGISDQIHFLGFRKDIKELFYAADIFLFTTFQEGMPRSMMEAMACGLPCIASKIRGNVDLLEDGMGGYLCDPDSAEDFATAISKMVDNNELRLDMAHHNLINIKNYDVSVVKNEIENIYREIFG